MKKLFTILTVILCAFALNLNAQDTIAFFGYEADSELGPHGDFWSSSRDEFLKDTVTDDAANAHTGSGYFHVTVTANSANSWDHQNVLEGIPVEDSTSYRFSIWYKGTGDGASINVTSGTYKWQDLNSQYGVQVSDEWQQKNLMVYITNSEENKLINDDGLKEDTIRFPVHFPRMGEYYIDDITCLKSTIAAAKFNDTLLMIDYGYQIGVYGGIDPSAYTVMVNDAEVAVNSVDTAISLNKIEVFLMMASSIPDDADVKISFEGSDVIEYSGAYSPISDDWLALPFENEIGEYDADLEFVDYVPSALRNYKAVKFEVFPNPVVDHLNITSQTEISEVTILDLTGKKIYESSISNQTTLNIDVSRLNSGMYLIQVQDIEGNSSAQKFIK